MSRPVSARRTQDEREPYGIGPIGTLTGPILAVVGLVVVAVATIGFMGGSISLPGSGNGPNGGGPGRTPAPSDVIIVDPRTEVPGAIVYAKAGNIWIQSGTTARQLSTNGSASMPSWSPDGRYVYYIDTVLQRGVFPVDGVERNYNMTIPRVMRIPADGSGPAELIATGRFRDGRYRWFSWLRQPVVAPNGRTIALISDQPDPETNDVVVQLLDATTGAFSNPGLTETSPLGHQDPAWHPSGRYLVYVRNGREGSRGAPVLARWDRRESRIRTITGPGYIQPEYSPDGRYIVATKTDGFGTDIVILEGGRGTEILRLTDDGRSWSPTWSPKGDSVAFLHIEAGIVDLRMVPLTGSAPAWTAGEALDLTSVSGLDGASGPDWFIPADQLPAPPTPSASPSSGGSPVP
jgi:Tol biopolymer transport system component